MTEILANFKNLFSCCCCAEKNVKEELINSSWCGVLAGLTMLLDARYRLCGFVTGHVLCIITDHLVRLLGVSILPLNRVIDATLIDDFFDEMYNACMTGSFCLESLLNKM